MIHNRDGPDIGFVRVTNCTRGDPETGTNNRHTLSFIMLIIYALTGFCKPAWGKHAVIGLNAKIEIKKPVKNSLIQTLKKRT